MSLDPDTRRKLAAKRTNERVKLGYTTVNALAIGVLGAAVIVPGVSSVASLLEFQRWIWLIIAMALHMLAQMIVGLLRSEE